MRRLAALALPAVLAWVPTRADDPARRGLDPDPPRPALGIDSQLTTESARTAPARSWSMGLELDWVHHLLSLESGGRRVGWVIPDRVAAHLMGAYSLGRFELGAGLPVALWQRDGLGALRDRGVTGPLVDPIASAALGDLRLSARTALLDEDSFPVSLGASLEVRLPTGDASAFASDGLGATPSLLAGRRLGRLRLDASLGYQFRRPGQYLQLVAHDALAAGAAASWDLPRWGRLSEWRAIADVAGLIPRGVEPSQARYRAPLSARVGVRARVWRSLWADLGAGTGLAAAGDAGYGRESFRLFAGLRWQHVNRDRDGDGVPDDRDRCPDAPGPAEWGGCPAPPDRDGDGVPDEQDRCPDVRGPAEMEGCPDQDGDGIPDIDDKCPEVPGPVQNDGCPLAPEEPVVEIETTRLSLRDMIHFDVDRDTIKPESGHILDEIASILRAHSEIGRIRIEGHTDNTGSRPYNLDLSLRRASAVIRALAARGVPPRKLEPAGYGFDRPVATNATAAGRARNRRVEFTIVDQGGAPAGEKPEEKPK
jgi:outer membrane protein OmpA-like peptidoglycan-associated protein